MLCYAMICYAMLYCVVLLSYFCLLLTWLVMVPRRRKTLNTAMIITVQTRTLYDLLLKSFFLVFNLYQSGHPPASSSSWPLATGHDLMLERKLICSGMRKSYKNFNLTSYIIILIRLKVKSFKYFLTFVVCKYHCVGSWMSLSLS